MIHPRAGTFPSPEDLPTRESIEASYRNPPSPLAPVKNGTSGHRGITGVGFSERHVEAMTQALVDIRLERGTFGPASSDDRAVNLGGAEPGPVVMGKDVRFGSDLALHTAAEVFAGNGMPVLVHRGDRSTPTPVVSHAIRTRNAMGMNVEGVIITASHNPPDEAGYKTNGMDGGPNTRTGPVDARANQIMASPEHVRRLPMAEARRRGLVIEEDLLYPYVRDLGRVIDMDVIRGIRFGASPLGGSAHGYYEAVNEVHGASIQVVLGEPDPTSSRRTLDWDGKLRGDPSSPWVMKAVEGLREQLGVPLICANDNDADRFGAEDSSGLLEPNHVLCVLFDYLCRHRSFPPHLGVGRTIGTTHLLDLLAREHGREVREVNVGFKWYVDGLARGQYVLVGEESAGLGLPCMDGSPWVTEKDGIAAALLMMEAVARTGDDLGALYARLVERHGPHRYERVDTPATPGRKGRLAALAAAPDEVRALLWGKRVAGRAVERLVVGDGVKVVLDGGVWVLKRASGTEDIIKDYREERADDLTTARQASRELDMLLGLEGL